MPPRKPRVTGSARRQPKQVQGQDNAAKNKKPAAKKASAKGKETARPPATREDPQLLDSSDGSDSDSDVVPTTESEHPKRSAIPSQGSQDRYCLFCYDCDGSRRQHSVPTAVELQALDTSITKLHRELHRLAANPQDEQSGQSSRPTYQQTQHRKYSVLLWQLERGQELRRKGFRPSFDLWIDHLALSEMINDDWTYRSVRARIPEDWIEDTDEPMLLRDKRPKFPPGTAQKGDIAADTAGAEDEDIHDGRDDKFQLATTDILRVRKISPVIVLGAEEENKPIGENLGFEAGRRAIAQLRAKQIPQTIRMWRDGRSPPRDRDGSLEMKDYLAAVHHLTEPGADQTPSTETYRAIANIAFAMEAANRFWQNRGITDEGYTRLTRDGFRQLAKLRNRLDEAGVTGLPPPVDPTPRTRVLRQKDIEPFVIHRWMDTKDNDHHRTYAYDPARPLGPMISENAHTSRYEDEKGAGLTYDKHGMVDLKHHTGHSSHFKLSREEIMGQNMELDQLVEDA